MKKKIIYSISIIVVILLIWVFATDNSDSKSIKVMPSYGEFTISVTVTGELDAEKSININGPSGLRSLGIYENIKINDLIDEGTVVDSGAYIGSLDQTIILNRLKDIDANLEKLTSKINKSKIDSALELRSSRDQLINLKYAIEEKEIEVENSKYEPPAVQRKLQIDLEKAQRQYDQSVDNYKLKKSKQINIIQEAVIDYNKAKREKEKIMKVMSEFQIKAPQAGMVIYAKSWSGKKKVPGSTISPWNPLVATLPDLTSMQVKSFVNEIDISKIKPEQRVKISIDAFPEKSMNGEVISVANIGEELQGSTAHVFEVVIKVEGSDEDLRPAMTTKNTIITQVLDSVFFIPLECLHATDSTVFVYSQGKKQIVETGESNEDNIIITKGISKNDEIYLSIPENSENWTFKQIE